MKDKTTPFLTIADCRVDGPILMHLSYFISGEIYSMWENYVAVIERPIENSSEEVECVRKSELHKITMNKYNEHRKAEEKSPQKINSSFELQYNSCF